MVTFPYGGDSLLGQPFPTANATLEIQAADGSWTSFRFEVDTGAAISVLPASAAQILGLNITTGTPLELSGVSGVSFRTYVHNLDVRFQGTDKIFKLPVAIATVEVPILLGRFGLWDTVPKICFNNTDGQTEIDVPTSAGSPVGQGFTVVPLSIFLLIGLLIVGGIIYKARKR